MVRYKILIDQRKVDCSIVDLRGTVDLSLNHIFSLLMILERSITSENKRKQNTPNEDHTVLVTCVAEGDSENVMLLR